ncbi:hypothetical protein AVEN_1800-1 [Araneus ventricosus]|uniref:Uncharacterized protein n=1 Tax=Araneus ventricosus TaxID=182803 RepID=A0A4Y2HXB0_ARAVE|nr:hypothetical protein AVEN_1800-1 [Araneus ventricosus]
MNVEQPPLAEPHKIVIPPLHIKLDLVKNLVQAMDKNGPAFKYLHEKFPRLSVTKIKEGDLLGLRLNSFSETLSLRNFFEDFGCNMSLKIHFLDSHLNFFPDNCRQVSDDHGERLHRDIANMENVTRKIGPWQCWILLDSHQR